MARNSIAGCFQDIEISFSTDVDCIRMNLRNLVGEEKQMRVMYQKQPTSGLANWQQFQLTNFPVSLRLPTEVLEAYRLTFFVDDAEPISARVEKVLAELGTLSNESLADDVPEDIVPEDIKAVTDPEAVDASNKVEAHTPEEPEAAAETTPNLPGIQPLTGTSSNINTNVSEEPEVVADEQAEATPNLPGIQYLTGAPSKVNSDVSETSEITETEQVETIPDLSETQPTDIPNDVNTEVSQEPEVAGEKQVETIPDLSEVQSPNQTLQTRPESQQEFDEQPDTLQPTATSSTIRKTRAELSSVNSPSEFRVTIPILPPSALAAQRKAQMSATHGNTNSKMNKKSKQKEKGFFGHLVRTLKGGKSGKAYYQERGETIQNEFQDHLSKLERDYNEGYGLNLISWKPESLCEEETAIFLLNLMVNEIIAWQKETGRAKLETGGIVETLAEVDTLLRQTLKQTRGISTPAPTLFPNLLAENARDLEKIRNECDAYLRRFTSKLIKQEKQHAAKIEILSYRKFLTEFIRDFLFAEIAKNTQGNALPKRLNWFLELVDSEVMPIDIGKTKVSPTHHKVKDARPSECEAGTIVEVITPGLQSKDGKRVNQMAVVIEAE